MLKGIAIRLIDVMPRKRPVTGHARLVGAVEQLRMAIELASASLFALFRNG